MVRILERAGFTKKRQTGSHAAYALGDHTVIVPLHNKPLPIGTIEKIIQGSGLDRDLFLTKGKR